MKNINSFIKNAAIITAVVAITSFSFVPAVFADDEDYSADSYGPDYSYSGDSYAPDYTYSSDSYSPDYTYDADSYSPDYTTYDADSYSPDYSSYEADSYSPDYSTSYEAPSYDEDTYASYEAPSASYASYTSGASYVSPSYSYASYVAPTYAAPVVYQTPVYNQPVYTQPTQQTLQATCYAPNTNAYVNQNVTWVVNATGGNGAYTYTWGGINLNGQHGQSVTTSYNSPGNETATVSVFSNGQTVQVNCGSIFVGSYQNNVPGITATCYPNVNSAIVGSSITWTAVVNGGNGNYSYSWSDNNGVNVSNGTGPTYTTTYPIAGPKSPRLTVSSLGLYGNGYNGNGSVTVTCQPVSINSGYNAGYTTTYITPPTGSLASLSSVSLNQVPYTGLADSTGFWAFIVGLLLASLAGTWYFMKVYARGKRRFMINLFKKNNLAQKLAA